MISFKSKITSKVLNYYFNNPEARCYVNELAKKLDLDPKNLHRKLEELEKEGIFKSEFRGKERYFFLDNKYPLLENYRQIFQKTIGIEAELRKIVKGVPKIKKAYIYGSYAKNEMDATSDIDLLVVGDHSILELQKRISALQKTIGREINVVSMSTKEFKEKKKDQFLINIFAGKHIKL